MGAVRSVGVEEELLVVDSTGVPTPKGPEALEAAERRDAAVRRGEAEVSVEHLLADGDPTGEDPDSGHLTPELKAQQIELGTRVCTDLAQIEKELRFWRARAEAVAAGVGAHVAALATSPVAVRPVPTEGERYGRIVDTFARTARDVLTCGCHVHVSVADDEEGVAVLDRIRGWLPVLTAVTANSPFWHGEDTGYASYRSQVWLRWPSAGPNEPFGDAATYHRLVDDVLGTGTVLDAGMVYFDARLSAKWPTVEVRSPDVALRVEDAVTLAGLVRGLVETAARQAHDRRPVPSVRTEVLRMATWRAARTGLSGDLVHPLTGTPAPAADVLAALADHVRPALADAGDDRLVDDGLAALLRRGTGADLQRRILRETADPRAVVRAAVAITGGADVDGAVPSPTD